MHKPMLSKGLRLLAAALVAAMIVPSAASAHGTHQKAKMSGRQVVGQPGAPNGRGHARLHLLRNKEKVCFKVSYRRIEGRTDLTVGVYKGRRGAIGRIEFWLIEDEKRSPIHGCVEYVPSRLLRHMTRHARRYHVTVKNSTFPIDGAIRGQLKGE
jgi:hypothetical protein